MNFFYWSDVEIRKGQRVSSFDILYCWSFLWVNISSIYLYNLFRMLAHSRNVNVCPISDSSLSNSICSCWKTGSIFMISFYSKPVNQYSPKFSFISRFYISDVKSTMGFGLAYLAKHGHDLPAAWYSTRMASNSKLWFSLMLGICCERTKGWWMPISLSSTNDHYIRKNNTN